MDEERYEANFCLSLWAPLHTLHLEGINLSSFPSGAVLVVLRKALAILNLLLRTFGTNGDIFEESERSFPLAMWAHIGLFRGSNPLKKKGSPGSPIRWMTTEDLTHFDFAFFPCVFPCTAFFFMYWIIAFSFIKLEEHQGETNIRFGQQQ